MTPRARKIPLHQAIRTSRKEWDTVAAEWDKFVEGGFDVHRLRLHGPALTRAVGPVRGLRVLDLGCGQGYFSRSLARRGAKVVAIDWSKGQIASALRHEKEYPLGIRFICGDASRTDRWVGPEKFDLAVSCMALMDMTDPERALRSVSRVLAPGSRLVFSITHPFCDAVRSRWLSPEPGRHGPRVYDHYFDEAPVSLEWRLRGTRGVMRAPQWHRTLTSWTKILHNAGFVLVRLEEPRASAALARQERTFDGCRRVPMYLIFEAKKDLAR